jgi:hypothetical protein
VNALDTTYRQNQAHDSLDPFTMKALGIHSVTDGLKLSDLESTIDNSLYGIPTRFVEEATDIWVPFGREATDSGIKGRDRLVLAYASEQFKKYESGTNADRWDFTRQWVGGFASLDDVRRYIELCHNWTSTEEITRAISRVVGSLESNETEKDKPSSCMNFTSAICSVVRYPAENPKALKQFKVWVDPDIWVCFYDLEKSKVRKAEIILTSANVWYPPTYDVPFRPKAGGMRLVDDVSSGR